MALCLDMSKVVHYLSNLIEDVKIIRRSESHDVNTDVMTIYTAGPPTDVGNSFVCRPNVCIAICHKQYLFTEFKKSLLDWQLYVEQ